MTNDAELLRRYVESQSEEAFTELVERNFDMIYFTALRRTNGDVQLAEDVAQGVFVSLAKSSSRVVRHPALAGWLHTATRNAAANVMRTEQRRKTRERQACEGHDSPVPVGAEADWNRISPEIDAAMDRLSEQERNAVLLRCLQDRPFTEIGQVLRITDEAARKRVARALEKLRALLASRGITSTSVALTSALTTQAALAAPPGLSTKIAEGALSVGVPGASPGAKLVLFMSKTKVIIALAMLAIIATGGLVLEYHSNLELRREVAAQRLAIPSSRSGLGMEGETALSSRGRFDGSAPEISTTHKAGADASQIGGMIPASAWHFRGTATAAEALESYLWAVDRVDVDATAKTIGFGKYRPKVDVYFSSLSQEIQKQFGTPEQLWAEVLTGSPHTSPVTAYSVLSEIPDSSLPGNYLSLDVQVTKANGKTEQGDMLFEQTPDGWRRVLPLTLIAPMPKLFPTAAVPAGTK
jgi:RNA polymerase sigma factor (sigma-70 family)